MGMSCLGRSSYSSYEAPKNEPMVSGNPDPLKYKIEGYLNHGRWLLLKVNYPDCRNFEGNKLLLFKDTTIEEIQKQGSLDPHFSNVTDKKSPVARFEPTDLGMRIAQAVMTLNF